MFYCISDLCENIAPAVSVCKGSKTHMEKGRRDAAASSGQNFRKAESTRNNTGFFFTN